jgi:hypothetical protein
MSKNIPFNTWLKKAKGCYYCIKTAPIPLPEASHSTTKGKLKFGNIRTGGLVTAAFNFSKAASATSFQAKAFFFNKSVKGAAIDP